MPVEQGDGEEFGASRRLEQTPHEKERGPPDSEFGPDFEPQTPLLKALLLGDEAIQSERDGLSEEAETKAMDAVRVLLAAPRTEEFGWFDLLARSYALALTFRTNRGDLQGALDVARTAAAVCCESVTARNGARRHARQNNFADTKGLAQQLLVLSQRLGSAGHAAEAIEATAQAVELLRTFVVAEPKAFLHDLVNSLFLLLSDLGSCGRWTEALATAQEVVDLSRQLADADGATHETTYAVSLLNKVICLGRCDRYYDALSVAREAATSCRNLEGQGRARFLTSLAVEVTNMAKLLGLAGRWHEELALMHGAGDLYRELVDLDRDAGSRGLAEIVERLAALSTEVGLVAEARSSAMQPTEENELFADMWKADSDFRRFRAQGLLSQATVAATASVDLCRALVSFDPEEFKPTLAARLNDLAGTLRELGRCDEALALKREAVELYRALARDRPAAFTSEVAGNVMNLSIWLTDFGRREEALAAAQQAAELFRVVARGEPEAFTHHLAMSLNNLGDCLRGFGRREEALAASQEAADLYRALARDHPMGFTHDLAMSLNNLGNVLGDLALRDEALTAAQEAVNLYRAVIGDHPEGHTADPLSSFVTGDPPEDLVPHLAMSLNNLGIRLLDLGRRDEALAAAREAAALYRSLARDKPGSASTHGLAMSMCTLGNGLRSLSRQEEALAATQEATDLFRVLAHANLQAFTPDLATSLNNLGIMLSELGRRTEALAACREGGACMLRLRPDDPYRWSQLCLGALRNLDWPLDLRNFHLPLLGLLTEHRELAWNDEHAGVFLALQVQVASRVWGLLASLPAEEGDLLDDAVAALVAALHSPDLSRWLEARGSGDGPLAKLAEIKREVIEAEQLLAALRKGLPGGDDAGSRAGWSGTRTEAQRGASMNDIDRQSARARALRQAFRDERARLVAEDPSFAAAFEPISPQALRSIARHAKGGGLLCVFELSGDGVTKPERSSSDRGRSVAALLRADGRRTQLLELKGVHELAWHARSYLPEILAVNRRGPLRGAPEGTTHSASDGASPPSITDLLAPRMSESFWAPLQQALQASGVAVERLHLCLHGTSQQLPLALRQAGDCPGLQVIPWPGLPYLRRAAMATTAKSESHTGADASAPWLVGHDCAWASEQPLPMVAVEAALLRDLLQRHGQPVQQIRLAAQLHGQASALVACCHGGAEQAQFDHALHLGQEPLTVRQIVQENLGPPLALLPACHAGRTDEDAAGNALGVAAAFMLSGTQVVAASSKAVPDLMQPWLSTLTVWHAMQGLPHHEAANFAREQFARLEFPEGYRSWLQQALPQALATIQPGGEEDEHIRGAHAQTAMEQVEERWPWEGETKDLFSADTARRDEATRSVVQGILRPRGGEAGARALAAEAREMAAFVFVYGVDGHPPA